MYRVLAQLEDGEYLHVACRNELQEAVQLIEGLNAYWPREYVLRDSRGSDVDLRGYTATELEPGADSSMRQ